MLQITAPYKTLYIVSHCRYSTEARHSANLIICMRPSHIRGLLNMRWALVVLLQTEIVYRFFLLFVSSSFYTFYCLCIFVYKLVGAVTLTLCMRNHFVTYPTQRNRISIRFLYKYKGMDFIYSRGYFTYVLPTY